MDKAKHIKAEKMKAILRDAEILGQFQRHFGLKHDQMLKIASLVSEFQEENDLCPYCHKPMSR